MRRYTPYVMARLPSLWGPDCEAFDPERHLQVRPPVIYMCMDGPPLVHP